jgi:hypothetical protein
MPRRVAPRAPPTVDSLPGGNLHSAPPPRIASEGSSRALPRLGTAQGHPAEAAEAHREALAVVDAVATGLSDPALRETLLASPPVAALRG